MRRYFHLGKKDIVALYSDVAFGAGYVYKVNGGYRINGETQGIQAERYAQEQHDDSHTQLLSAKKTIIDVIRKCTIFDVHKLKL